MLEGNVVEGELALVQAAEVGERLGITWAWAKLALGQSIPGRAEDADDPIGCCRQALEPLRTAAYWFDQEGDQISTPATLVSGVGVLGRIGATDPARRLWAAINWRCDKLGLLFEFLRRFAMPIGDLSFTHALDAAGRAEVEPADAVLTWLEMLEVLAGA